MRAVVVREFGQVEVAELDVDEPGRGELSIRTTACGLCHSDLHAVDGSFPASLPMVVGHEVAGIVEAVGDGVVGFQVGDQVAVTSSPFCGACPACDRGDQWLCHRRGAPPLVRPEGEPPRVAEAGAGVSQFLDIGGFAERVVVSQQAAVVVPDAVPPEVAAILGCGVLTGVGTITNVARVSAGESVVVVGCGGVGLAAVQGARIAGASTIVAVDLSSEALELAERMGATHLVRPPDDDPVRVTRRITDGADHVIEAIGLPDTMQQATEMVRPGGTVYLVGLTPVGTKLAVDAFKLVWFNRTVRGVLMGANRFRRDVPRLAELYLGGRLDVEALITDRISLEDVPPGLDAMRRGAVGRAVAILD
jgi:S-(hydroxymethyl)glutathione dehydrogenase/alcohol dehydrogenase